MALHFCRSYLGNEADVTLYLNNTGLMWESAPSFRALLVFAEHRHARVVDCARPWQAHQHPQ
jgi:hypothetical protein